MPQSDRWSIGRLLTWTTDYLKRSGAENPRLDAEVLLSHARRCQRIELYTAFDEEVDDDVRAAFRELVRRRAEGTPVAYLVGRREFYSLSFRVTPDVLIPRPETEFVVITLLDLIKQRESSEPVDIADVGTGSGIIAICAAKHAPSSRVTAIDIRPLALQVARSNAQDHHVTDRVELIEGDLLSCLPAERQFDFVVSNPPYVAEPELNDVAPQVKDYEPREALVAGPTGTEVIQRLIPQAAQHLHHGGWLILEISPMIESRVRDLIAADGRFETSAVVKDLSGLPRVIRARRNSS
jgi:release factor glutamine methyltransferase